jgi:rRNA maturation endonuclease Nob1
LQRRRALDTHLPIQQIKWLYRCGGCMEEFVYHPFDAKVEPKEEWAAMQQDRR